MKKCLDFLNNLTINKTDYLIVGCSGGPDSMCLLDLLYKHQYKIICAHINHNLRKESNSEYDFVRKYCQKKDIIFRGLELENESSQNESYYRKKRYDFYKQLADEYNSPYIITAHHGDDLIETILMRITRGSNLKGYSGFSKCYKEDGYIFIKPLIYYTKEEIQAYNDKNNIPSVHDSSNDSNTYTRNRYRHNVLPFLKSENKKAHLKYLQYNELLEETTLFIERLVDKAIKENFNSNAIDLNKFSKLDKYIQKAELETILKKLYKNDILKLQLIHLDSILSLLEKGKNFSYDLPLDFKVTREYDKLHFGKTQTGSAYSIEFTKEAVLPNGDKIVRVDSSEDASNYTIRINSKDVVFPLYIRTRKMQDKIAVKNLNGTKSVKNIFIDEKVPASIRKTYPILTDANDKILWIPGVKKSKFDNEKNEKYDIILRYIEKGDY